MGVLNVIRIPSSAGMQSTIEVQARMESTEDGDEPGCLKPFFDGNLAAMTIIFNPPIPRTVFIWPLYRSWISWKSFSGVPQIVLEWQGIAGGTATSDDAIRTSDIKSYSSSNASLGRRRRAIRLLAQPYKNTPTCTEKFGKLTA